MTACVNKKSKRVAAVVTASLVGALSIGAPAVALADTNIDMLVAGDIEDVAGGKVIEYTDQDGKTVDSTEFKVGSEAQYLIPTKIETATGQQLGVDGTKIAVNYYKANANGATELPGGIKADLVQKGSIKGAGTYYAGVYAAGASNNKQVCLLKFTIVNKSLAGVVVTDGSDANDTTIEYTGIDQHTTLGFALDGKLLTYNTDFLVEFYAKGAAAPLAKQEVKNAGDYVARVTGKGLYEGSVVDVPFTVEKLDLSKAVIELANSNAIVNTPIVAESGLSVVGELDASVLQGLVDLKFVSASNGALAPSTAKGAYTYEVVAQNPVDTSIVNSAKVTVVRYGKAATFSYDGAEFTGTKTLTGNIDLSKVAVKDDKQSVNYTVTYLKGNEVVSEEEAKTPGTYTAVITVDDSTYELGGSAKIQFTVAPKVIEKADIFVTYDGKVTGNKLDVIYNGSDFLSQLKVSATDKDGEKVPAGELVLSAKVKSGEEVDSIVDAGTYTVTVKAKGGSMYEVSDGSDSLEVTVSPIKLTKAVLHGTVTDLTDDGSATDGLTFLPYTGAVLTPSWTFENADGDAIEVPESAWKVSYDKEVKKEGDYTATFSRTVGTKNYDFTGLDEDFKVKKAVSFADVQNSDWFVGSVFQAKENGYVNGVKGTKLFNPNANITRADAVCILYNMAGGKKVEDMTAAEKLAWTSKVTFSDVDVDQYFGVAMGWADSLDIANGSNGVFRPYDTITREEFAALLSNYAKANGDYEAVDADEVLGSATDYTGWAKQVVAWAKANGVMGNNGAAINGTGVITRAEVAAMAVNYQPEAL